MNQNPFLTPQDLNIDLEEDSTDFTEAEASSSIETTSLEDFQTHLKVVQGFSSGWKEAQLRRRQKILYCRLLGGGEDVVFKVDWLRSL